jgi:hypothetical protein
MTDAPTSKLGCSSIDLPDGTIMLTDGQRLPITRYLGPTDEAPPEGASVDGFAWVSTIVAGPDADGEWWTIQVENADREPAK